MTTLNATRAAGVLLHPTSLPGPYGIGDLGGSAYRWVDRLAQAKQTWWQMLPLNPTGLGDSPYSSFSAFAGNPLLVSAAKENLCTWNFASHDMDSPLPLTVEYEYRIDKARTATQLSAEVTYDLPNRVSIVAPAYSASCLCVKKKSKWKFFGR